MGGQVLSRAAIKSGTEEMNSFSSASGRLERVSHFEVKKRGGKKGQGSKTKCEHMEFDRPTVGCGVQSGLRFLAVLTTQPCPKNHSQAMKLPRSTPLSVCTYSDTLLNPSGFVLQSNNIEATSQTQTHTHTHSV
jgi:hypothetical protein